MEVVSTSPFDNELSLLYKWAHHFHIPIRYLLAVPQTNGEVKYEPTLDFIARGLASGQSLSQIYMDLLSLQQNLTLNEFLLLSVPLIRARGLRVQETLNQTALEVNPENEMVPFSSTAEVDDLYNDWLNQTERQRARDEEKLERILVLQEELGKQYPLFVSPLHIDQMKLLVYPEGASVIKGLDIFNSVQLSSTVPYIQFNDGDGQRYYKILPNFDHDYNLILQPSARAIAPNTFYFTVWLREGKYTKESFVEGTYNLETNRFIFPTPVQEGVSERVLLDKVALSFPTLRFPPHEALRVSGEFNIYQIGIDRPALLDLITNSELLSTYLYVEETSKPFAEKKRFTIHYKSTQEGLVDEDAKISGEGYIKSTSAVAVTLTPHQVTEESEEVEAVDGEGKIQKFYLPKGTSYLHVRLRKALNRKMALKFIEIFRRLLYFYALNGKEIHSIYEEFIPRDSEEEGGEKEVVASQAIKVSARGGKGGELSRNDALKQAAPEYFSSGYSRVCQAKNQPIIIPPNEITAWTSQTFVHKDRIYNRQVLPYPAENPILYLGCPDPRVPFPGVIINKKNTTASVPYAPCCYSSSHMNPEDRSYYNQYYRGVQKKTTDKDKTEFIIKLVKILDPGRLGSLPLDVEKLLQQYNKNGTFSRYGIPAGPNSLLRCIAFALDAPHYVNQPTEMQNKYIDALRTYLASNIQPSLLSQELYDKTEAEIRLKLADPEEVLDPYLYYRAVEEIFNVNLFVFITPNEDDETVGMLEVPRHKVFHVRAPRPDRPTIIIHKKKGHCELVVDYNKTTKAMTKHFDQQMTALLYDTLIMTNRTISYRVQDGVIDARSNFYTLTNFYTFTGKNAQGQYVDDYGKLRALILGNGLTLVVPPSQPENLPLHSRPLPRGTLEEARATFGDNISAVSRERGLVTGLWYPLEEVKTGLYVPIVPVADLDYPEGPADPLTVTGSDVTSRTRNLHRTLYFFLQLLRWLYLLYLGKKPNGTPDDFAQRYLRLAPTNYDITTLPHLLPEVTSVEEAIAVMNRQAPSFFSPTSLLIYNEAFGTKIQMTLEKLSVDLEGLELEIPKELYGYYELAQDFQNQPNTAIFVGERDLALWLAEQRRPETTLIREKLDRNDSLSEEPYLYRDNDGRYYQIQNVLGGQERRALQVAWTWYHQKINPGFNAIPLDPLTEPVRVIYSIAADNHLIVVDDKSNGSPVFLQILHYGQERYGALLPIV